MFDVQRVCFLLKLRSEKIEEYRTRHRKVWPEMRSALEQAGWTNYTLFLGKGGLLVGYLECDDFVQAKARMQHFACNAEWQMEVAPFFEELGGAPDDGMEPLEEIFHLDGV
jgi:L-rhamnose mutarotase